MMRVCVCAREVMRLAQRKEDVKIGCRDGDRNANDSSGCDTKTQIYWMQSDWTCDKFSQKFYTISDQIMCLVFCNVFF